MILDEIVAKNREALAEKKRLLPFSQLERLAVGAPKPRDFAAAISQKGIRLIAELDPVQVALEYAGGGAAAISVLTEPRYFQGSLNNLSRIRTALSNTGVPLLRKDFLSDPYEIYESRVYGADALLLIVAILSPSKLKELLLLSHELGMKCLVEVHNEKEIETALEINAGIIGINNRDLTTFEVDVKTTERLRHLIPSKHARILSNWNHWASMPSSSARLWSRRRISGPK
jgi:indole-3-glycerol phosphate synthase